MASRTIDVAGGTLDVLDVPAADADGERPPLVLLHEGLGSVGLWRGWPDTLAAATGRRAIAFSRFGHGRSGPPPRPRRAGFLEEEAELVLPAVLDALDVREPLLVGHSDGGTIALLYAAAGHPVEGLVVMAPHVHVETEQLSGITPMAERYRSGGLRERMARHHDDPDAAFHGWFDPWVSEEFRDWRMDAHALGAIEVPILAIQGEDDEYATLVHLERIVAETAGPARMLVVAGGHSPHLDVDAAAVTEAVVAFAADPRSATCAGRR